LLDKICPETPAARSPEFVRCALSVRPSRTTPALVLLTRSLDIQYLSTPAALLGLMELTSGSVDRLGGADICACAGENPQTVTRVTQMALSITGCPFELWVKLAGLSDVSGLLPTRRYAHRGELSARAGPETICRYVRYRPAKQFSEQPYSEKTARP